MLKVTKDFVTEKSFPKIKMIKFLSQRKVTEQLLRKSKLLIQQVSQQVNFGKRQTQMKDCEKMLKINLNVTKEKINVIIDEMPKSFFLFTFKYNILYDVM